MKIGSIVIHRHDFDRTVAFWQAALHYVPREPAKDDWVVLRGPEDKGPNLSFQGRVRSSTVARFFLDHLESRALIEMDE